MMSRRVASSSQQNSDFLAGLFDDISASRVVEEMKLGVVGAVSFDKRQPEDFLVSFPDSERYRPRKKCRMLSPLPPLSVRSRASTQNLAELSFPPLQEVLKASRHNHPSIPDQPFSVDALPIPHMSLSRRRRVSLRSSPTADSSSSSSETIAGGFSCPHFIPPDTTMMDDEGSQVEDKTSHHHRQNPSLGCPSDSNFGWFVDLDHHHHHDDDSYRATKCYQRQVSVSSPDKHCSMDFLAYRAPVAPNGGTDADADLEWAMAVDAIDSIFGGSFCDDIDGS